MFFLKRLLRFSHYLLWGFFVNLANFVATGKVSDWSYIALLRDSEIIPSPGNGSSLTLLKQQRQAERVFIEGNFSKAIKLREKYMRKVYDINQADVATFFPPNFSNSFGSNIGHVAWLFAHISAQELGLIPKFKRTLSLPPQVEFTPLVEAVRHGVTLVPRAEANNFGDLPSNWLTYERLDCWKTFDGFVDPYVLIDKIFGLQEVTPGNPLVRLSEAYRYTAKQRLLELGLPEDQWFVGLHIRNAGKSPSKRNQLNSNYYAAIHRIRDLGGWVIRIGDPSMEALPNLGNTIDLAIATQEDRSLHAFVMSESKFFVGTTSGPSFVAPFFGTPCLITNVTSPGRNTLKSSKHSIYITKKVRGSHQRYLSLSEILSSPEGFGELSLRDLARKGLFLEENSASEIVAAVDEIHQRLRNEFNLDEDINRRVQEIRSEFFFASKGEISHTFIRANPHLLT